MEAARDHPYDVQSWMLGTEHLRGVTIDTRTVRQGPRSSKYSHLTPHCTAKSNQKVVCSTYTADLLETPPQFVGQYLLPNSKSTAPYPKITIIRPQVKATHMHFRRIPRREQM